MPYLHSPQRWMAATAKLSPAQVGAYHRLVEWMDANGCLLPISYEEQCEIAGAKLVHERAAVEHVVRLFFDFTSHGMVQRVAHQRAGNADNDPERQRMHDRNALNKRRSRAQQTLLRQELAKLGVRTTDAMSNSTLRELLDNYELVQRNIPESGREASPSRDEDVPESGRDCMENHAPKPTVTADVTTVTVTGNVTTVTDSVTGNVTDSRARGVYQGIQNTNTNTLTLPSVERAARALPDAGADEDGKSPLTRQGEAGIALKAGGLCGVNTSHPRLLALLDAGVTPTELQLAATEASARGKGFAYVLGMVEGRRRDSDAAGPVPGPAGPLYGGYRTAREQADAERVRQWAPGLEAKPNG